ncbi:hypothetical protein [Desulfosporosinus orientis]|uniref:hypothetical protein n=1 Tax=Desulfosporosinus orientis TaxID=1563 RepID=UPI0002E7D9DE|nr:hypothetical protein [Desulfosporosinus orientis]
MGRVDGEKDNVLTRGGLSGTLSILATALQGAVEPAGVSRGHITQTKISRMRKGRT